MHTVERDDLAAHLDFRDSDRALRVERGGEAVIDPSPIGLSTPAGEFPEDYEFVGSITAGPARTVEARRRSSGRSARRS